MNEILLISIGINFFLAMAVVFFSFKDEHKKNLLTDQQRQLSRTLYEVSILNQVSEKLGGARDYPSIAQTIALTIEQLMEVTTVSYAIQEENEIVAKTYTDDNVTDNYLKQVDALMRDSMEAIDPDIRLLHVKHEVTRNDTKSHTSKPIDIFSGSIFHIPLVFHNTYYGVITVTNKKPGAYQKADMEVLYKIVRQTERSIERLEEVVTSEKGKLDALVVSLPSGAILLTLDNGYLSLSTINHAACDFLNVPSTADATRVIASLGTSHDFVRLIKDVMRDKTSMMLPEVPIKDKFYKIFLNPVFGYDANSIIGVNVTLQDVTREKELDKLKQTFTSMIVHELRAPLVSIKGASQLLMGDLLPEDEKKKMLGTIKVSVDRMLNQVSDLLDSSKLEAGKFDISLSQGNINNVITDRVSVLNYDAEIRKVKLESHLDPHMPEFEFDPERMGQVVNNLISNALKFTKAGGTVTIKSCVENGFAAISITDTGIGIPEDKKALLFSKYSQLESIAKSKGTGLGLYISKGIVEAHHGKIKLDSEVGKGTTVTVMIPLKQEKAKVKEVQRDKGSKDIQGGSVNIPVQHLTGHPGNVVVN